jgi:excinuclease ABC subunit C
LSEKNARIFMLEKKRRAMGNFESKRQYSVVNKMQEVLGMDLPPLHIEAFDNSNFQGSFPVAACVVFKSGKPAPSLYRHFNIKTVEGPDDYASMEEVVYRRYKRILDEQNSLPQLILIDGGKGQLESAAVSLRKLGILEKVKLISIAKKLETIFTYGDNTPLYIDKKSPVLRLFQQIRDEVHRFGITHHRKQRSKATIQTALTDISGIGPNTASKLLKHFGSVEAIKNTSQKELEAIIGPVKALTVRNALKEDI